jgi:hypothetical protein
LKRELGTYKVISAKNNRHVEAPMDNIIQINQGKKNQLGNVFFKYPQPLRLLLMGISGSDSHRSLKSQTNKWKMIDTTLPLTERSDKYGKNA